ncbi:MAG TPA: matrixin family metalloprotease [Candidatus Polarisedimenticolia bacterium]|nr:matrixin family metalloprotease [Candidatus Polarisedimenticolia bacterium]
MRGVLVRAFRALACAVLTLCLVVTSASANHNLTGRKWDPQAYGIYNYAPRYYPDSTVPIPCRTSFNNAAATWNNVGTELRFVNGLGYPVHIDYFFIDAVWPWNDNVAYTLMDLVGGIGDADIRFNTSVDAVGNETWFPYCGSPNLPPPDDYYDMQGVAVHEMGHTHEQIHTTSTLDIMNENFSDGLSKHTLSTHDRQSLTTIYGIAH